MATLLTYATTITIVKLSMLLLYRRLFVTPTFRLITTLVSFLCMLWFIIAGLLDIFQCRPVSAAFDARLLFIGSCINLQAYYWGVISTNMVGCLS